MAAIAGQSWSTFAAGPKTTTFALAGLGAELGDQLVLIVGHKTGEVAVGAWPPPGWTALGAGAYVASPYEWKVAGRVAGEDDVGAAASPVVLTGTGTITVDPAGAVVRLTGTVPGAPLVQDATPIHVVDSRPASTDVDWGWGATTQPDDLRLVMLWALHATATFVDTSQLEMVAQNDYGPGRLLLARCTVRTFPHAPLSDSPATVSTACDTSSLSLSLRTKPVARPRGVTDPIPGSIGLVL